MKTFSVLCCIILILYTAKSLQAKKPEVCKNGGKTLGNTTYPKCHCPDGYKGYDCNQKVTPCEGEPCRNYATCVEHEDGTFSCKCPHNYEGILCEKRVTPCDRHPCKNGGKCTDDGVKCFKCACPDGYKGSDCSKKVLPCEVSPCKNGAVCVNKKDGDFKCACKSGYRGLLCESKDGLFESLSLKDKPDYLKQLEDWVGKDNQWRVCYRASRDGWRAGDFHSRCDHKGPTVSIIRVGYYIFGGYADVSWGGTTGYRRSTTSFLFSLRNRDNLKPFKAPVYQNHANAIYQNPSYGVTFGGGHDLHINDNSHTSTGSYTNFGHTYRPPPGYKYSQQKTKDLLAGTYNGFKPDEIEVFYLR